MVGSVALSPGTYCQVGGEDDGAAVCGSATSPFQDAFTRAGTECVTHIRPDRFERTYHGDVSGRHRSIRLHVECVARYLAVREFFVWTAVVLFVGRRVGRNSHIQQGERGEQGDGCTCGSACSVSLAAGGVGLASAVRAAIHWSSRRIPS